VHGVNAVVMTGGTSGLGLVTARRITAVPDTRLLLGARASKEPFETLPLDLTRLASVREFAHATIEALGAARIDALILNAGVQVPDINHRTEDGFETTFAANHLAHYLLLRLLVPRLADGAIVIITTSDTHDPETNPMGAPKSVDPEQLAHPSTDGRSGFRAGFRAYAASKLCNLLTARALAALPEATDRHWRVIAYNPGFTPGTGLNREWPAWARLAGIAGTALRPVARLATVEQAGDALADLALGHAVPPAGRIYASLVKRRLTWPDPSALAQRDDLVDALWRQSARMVGLPESA
jgi:NAD(P)-dependent dehydrogenase (short-subunit alcohol dehydrogenase family)